MNSALIVAAGRGSRMGSAVSKQYLHIGGRAILYWTIQTFVSHPAVDELIVIIRREDELLYKKEVEPYLSKKGSLKLTYGGDERTDSVQRGLELLHPKAQNLLIHDGVRPFVRHSDISAVLKGLEKFPACVSGVYVKDTIKIVDEEGFIRQTPNRNFVFAVHTPQAFRRRELCEAYQQIQESKTSLLITDEAFVMEQAGYPVKIVEGSYQNIKITTVEDHMFAEMILRNQRKEAGKDQ